LVPQFSLQPALGASVTPLSLTEMAHLSDEIIFGVVSATESRWTEDRISIVTDVHIRVVEAVKGAPSGEIVVTEPGGVVGALRVEVAGVGSLRPGQEAILFLSRDVRDARHVTGLGQGRLDVRPDPVSGLKRVRFPRSSSEPSSGGLRSEPAAEWRPLEEFLTEVRSVVQDGER
jgi:hypothetical protein